MAEHDETGDPTETGETPGGRAGAAGNPDPLERMAGDYYATLGVSASASLAEIKRAFHREAKRWHPDRFASAPPDEYERAGRRMRQVTEAYHALSDPAARAAYDASLRGDETPTGPGGVSSSIVGGFSGGVAHDWHDWSGGEHATTNPNGAGMFFAALAAVVGLALLTGVASGGAGSNIPLLVGAIALLVILAIAAAAFMTGSPASRWAEQVMEGEPRGFTPRTARRAARPQPDVTFTTAAPGPEDADAAFARLVAEALATVPDEFRPYMRNIAVEVEREPSAETLRESGVPEGYTLLGLYRGVPLDKRGAVETAPDIITIYRGPIERHSGPDSDAIREQVRATTLHELAHHFGLDHEEMPEWVK